MVRRREEGDRRFIQKDVYTQYCGYTTKMVGYTQCGYNAKSWSDICTTADIPELGEICLRDCLRW